MTGVLGLDPLDPQWADAADAGRGGAATRLRSPPWSTTSSRSARRPAPAATSPPPTRCATGSPPPGVSVEDTPDGPTWSLKDA